MTKEKEVKKSFDLERSLTTLSGDLPQMLVNGSTPSLLEVSKNLYKQWKDGNMASFCENTEDLKVFYAERKRDIALNLIAFLHLTSSAILDQDKIDASSIKDISGAILNAVKILESLTEEPKPIKHEHKHAVVDASELDAKLQEARAQLQAIEAEFTELNHTQAIKNVDL
jgi:hypothetical protein